MSPLHGAHKPQDGPRVYCPFCGEVRGSEHYSRKGSPFVYKHRRNDKDMKSVWCPGGPVDLVEDAAT